MSRNGGKSTQAALITAERRRQISDWVLQRGSVVVSELAEAFAVGTQTIRNDLDALQAEGKLTRSYGGAVARHRLLSSLPYAETRAQRTREKDWIGQAALGLMPQPGSGLVYIDAGSTAYQLAVKIHNGEGLRIVTNGLDCATHLATNSRAEVILLGGRVLGYSVASDLSASRSVLDQLYFEVAFLSGAGLDTKCGITGTDLNAADSLRLVMEHSGKVVMLCDSSKIGRISHVRLAPVSLIDVLITDGGISPDQVKEFEDNEVEVIVAGPSENGGLAAKGVANAVPLRAQETLVRR